MDSTDVSTKNLAIRDLGHILVYVPHDHRRRNCNTVRARNIKICKTCTQPFDKLSFTSTVTPQNHYTVASVNLQLPNLKKRYTVWSTNRQVVYTNDAFGVCAPAHKPDVAHLLNMSIR